LDWKKIAAVAAIAGTGLTVASAVTGKKYVGLQSMLAVVVIASWLGGGGASGVLAKR
jgi:hypothetical protein